MKPEQMVLRCYAEQRNGLWSAVCLDLSLAAQGNSLEEARQKLHNQVVEYIEDAIGQDEAHWEYLLSRKAPALQWAKYYTMKVRNKAHLAKNGMMGLLFKERLPLRLA